MTYNREQYQQALSALVGNVLTEPVGKVLDIYNSGLYALLRTMESIWNKNHNPVSDRFALKTIDLFRKHLPELCQDPDNIDLRTSLRYASLFAGLAFSNTKAALAHAISYPLTVHFGLPYGLACALPLLHVLWFNGKRAAELIGIMVETLGTDRTSE